MSLVIANELRLLGSHGMQAHRYPEMFAFMERTQLDLKWLLAGTVSLEDVPELLPLLNLSPVAGMRVVEM